MLSIYVPCFQGLALFLMTTSITVLFIQLHKLKPFLQGQQEVFKRERRQMITILIVFDVSCVLRGVLDRVMAEQMY